MKLKPDYVKLLDMLGQANNANEGLSVNNTSDYERLLDAKDALPDLPRRRFEPAAGVLFWRLAPDD